MRRSARAAYAGLSAPQRQADNQTRQSHCQPIDGQWIDEHVDVFRLIQSFQKAFKHRVELSEELRYFFTISTFSIILKPSRETSLPFTVIVWAARGASS